MTPSRDSITWIDAVGPVRFGHDDVGAWWIDDMPDGSDLTGPYDDGASAREASEAAAILIRLRDGMPERIVLDDVSFERVSRAIRNPPPPNAKLRALFKKK